MNYIQLENFNGNLSIVSKDDGSGEPLIFNNLKEAQDTLEENCQNGQIVPLGINTIYIIKELYETEDDTHVKDIVLDILDY